MPIATPEVYRDMLDRAKAGSFAYPAINVTSSQTLNAAIRGFAEAGSDGIVQVSTGGAEYLSGPTVKDMVTGSLALAAVHARLTAATGRSITMLDLFRHPTIRALAASLDGASLWKQFTNITLPMVKPANAVLLLIMSLWIFNQFNVPYVLFGPASPEQATLISPLIYQQSFNNWNFGLGGAMSVMLLVVLLIASAFYIRMVLPKGQNDND